MPPSCSASSTRRTRRCRCCEAEWSLLIQPARVQELVERHAELLKLQPLDPAQITKLENLPMRPKGPAPEDESALSAILEGQPGDADATIGEQHNDGDRPHAVDLAARAGAAATGISRSKSDPERRGRAARGARDGRFRPALRRARRSASCCSASPPHGGGRRRQFIQAAAQARPDIVDRNGETLATDIKTASLFAEPRYVIDPDEATELLDPRLPRPRPRPAAQAALHRRRLRLHQARRSRRASSRRCTGSAFPASASASRTAASIRAARPPAHVLGTVNIDNQGIAGIEKYIDAAFLDDLHAAGFATGHALEPVQLSIDLRVQHVVRDELAQAMESYQAIAAIGIVIDVNTGEVLGMSSLPDYDPNNRDEALDPDKMNRATVGVFEMGSTFKGFTTAMALDSGRVNDQRQLRRARRADASAATRSTISTASTACSPCRRSSSTPPTSARRGWRSPPARPSSRSFLKQLGLLDPLQTELPEVGAPIVPKMPWSKISSMTIAFGHGISVSPMQTAVAGAALINGGYLDPADLPAAHAASRRPQLARQVMRPETSRTMRQLFRLNVLKGSGRRADVPGYSVGGKTGTAEKVVNGRYSGDKRRNAFLAGFPMDAPKYLVLVVLDEPKPEKPGIGATAGLNAAPTVEQHRPPHRADARHRAEGGRPGGRSGDGARLRAMRIASIECRTPLRTAPPRLALRRRRRRSPAEQGNVWIQGLTADSRAVRARHAVRGAAGREGGRRAVHSAGGRGRRRGRPRRTSSRSTAKSRCR